MRKDKMKHIKRFNEVIPIDIDWNGYSEESKYNKFSISQLEKIFNDRLLDWNHYYTEALKSSNRSGGGMWSLTVSNILVDDLINYDDYINDYYKTEFKKGISIKDIFINYAKDKSINNSFCIFDIKSL